MRVDCPKCHATLNKDKKECWLCGKLVTKEQMKNLNKPEPICSARCPGCGVEGGRQCKVVRSTCGF